MPHFGQSPGLSDSTPGHIGQKYFAVVEVFFILKGACFLSKMERVLFIASVAEDEADERLLPAARELIERIIFALLEPKHALSIFV
jgi:hypothetical protein